MALAAVLLCYTALYCSEQRLINALASTKTELAIKQEECAPFLEQQAELTALKEKRQFALLLLPQGKPASALLQEAHALADQDIFIDDLLIKPAQAAEISGRAASMEAAANYRARLCRQGYTALSDLFKIGLDEAGTYRFTMVLSLEEITGAD